MTVIWLGLCLGSIVALPFSNVWVFLTHSTWFEWGFVVAAGVLQALYFELISLAYRSGEISVVYPVMRGVNIIGTSIAGVFFLNESVSVIAILGTSSIVLGTVFIGTAAGFGRRQLKPVFFAIFIGCLLAGSTFIDKIAVGRITPQCYIFGMFFLSAVVLAPWVFIRYRAALVDAYRHSKRYIAVVGIGPLVSYGLILFAFRLGGPLGRVVAVREVSVAIGAAYGFVLFSEKATWNKIVGLVLMLGGAVVLRWVG